MTRDEVVKGLECHIKGDCVDCPYREGWHTCNLTPEKGPFADALSLLKQEPKRGRWIEYPECLAYDGAFSEDHIVCSECKNVWSIMDNDTETFRCCPNCGARMEED